MITLTDRVYNFSAGPCTLPVPVLEQAREDLLNWKGAGMSVMEMSHRGKAFMQIAAEAEADARAYLNIPANFKVLWLQGGASLQFTMLAMNFMHGKGGYVTTGTWGKKAVEAAAIQGEVVSLYDAKASNYDHCPDLNSLAIPDGLDYVHITSNETIQGVDFLTDPPTNATYVCDMSSNIGSRPIDWSRYAMVYAGAQKNLGPAGVTLAFIREDWFDRVPAGLPPMLDYKLQMENDSMYNTPPCWSMYMCGLVFKHWLAQGGVSAVHARNEAKAQTIYEAIDGSGGFYRGHAQATFRSRMNISFTLANDSLTDTFVAEAKANGMVELKGHRSVGGCRASIYNAFPLDGCQALADFMRDFAQRNG